MAVFTELSKYPELSSAKFGTPNEKDIITVESIWSQRCIGKNTTNKFGRNYVVSNTDCNVISKSRPLIHVERYVELWNSKYDNNVKLLRDVNERMRQG